MVIASRSQREVAAVSQRCNAFPQKRPAGRRVNKEASYWSAYELSYTHVYNQPKEVA
jgi:hypothetical protein